MGFEPTISWWTVQRVSSKTTLKCRSLTADYTIKSGGSSWNWTKIDGSKTPLDDNEPTAPYITGWELNLRKLPDRQWESNPQPSRKLQPMTTKAGASTETVTVTCNVSRYHAPFPRSLTSKNVDLKKVKVKEKNSETCAVQLQMFECALVIYFIICGRGVTTTCIMCKAYVANYCH